MINIYPANRLENLVFLLERVMQTGNYNVLSEEIILVQSKGMQHWLNLKLAESRGISMNLNFSLPMQFFWNQIRAVLGKDQVPEQSSYTREVMSWRIHDLLASDAVVSNPVCQEATDYWFKKEELVIEAKGDEEKRFQLACQIADLFEQYLIFRPDWLLAWEKGHLEPLSSDNNVKQWQAFLWQLLVEQDPLHPINLLKQAMLTLEEDECHLPERISLFGINTLPPLWLEFLSELGKQTQVHFFHLNPCVEYWGDLKTDKALAREQFYRWLNSSDVPIIDEDLNNPLLSNLGTQGKDFLYLLQEHTSIEIPVYESPEELSYEKGEQATVLQKIQTDILNLHDVRRLSDEAPQRHIDDSIFLASAHSALREIQALHDWLLHQINNDESLTPKDILVMCPNVEDYAPYVDAVFAHGWNDWSEQVPPLPCSIADRTLKDSEPLVQAFIDLLDLPDSRFQVSQILGYLRLPALQQKFSFSEDDLLLLERWVNHASIHWGLNAKHKAQILIADSNIKDEENFQSQQHNSQQNQSEHYNDKFTWQQGLERLLLGFAQCDQNMLYQEQLLLPDVEGDEALLLGRYLELLEQLQSYARELQTPRKPNEWKQFLLQIKDNLFSPLPIDVNAQKIIEQAIDDLGEYTSHAHYDKAVPLNIIRDFLSNHFSQPEPGRQFMAGQVTFCSMVPMRSVPFRIIAVLGLNDGEFPRQRQPMGFDLMSMEPARKGDRSRRGDDRYLFLEAIISCRDKLYLSYQGHDIKTNNTREPSLVLQELMDYLEKGYGWSLSSDSALKESAGQLFKVPLQAFNKANYQNSVMKWKSFNAHWLKLSEPGKFRNNVYEVMALSSSDELIITIEQLVQFFDHPSKAFAQNRLGLFFEQKDLMTPDDSEPFVSNHLDRYLIQDALIKTVLSNDVNEKQITDLMTGFKLNGTLPDTPNTNEDLELWQEQAIGFAQYVQSEIEQDITNEVLIKSVEITIDNVTLQAELPLLGNRLFFWRLASPKGKDDIRLWLHHLLAQIMLENISTTGIFRGDKKGNGESSILSINFEPDSADWAREQLSKLIQCWKEGMQKPLLLNAILGQKHLINKPLSDYGFSVFWSDDFQTQGLGSDPYMNWFWGDSSEEPQWEKYWQERIEKVYSPLYSKRHEMMLSELGGKS
ncbi:MAG: exodeoxyribonuclease V subunit gamma [Gammaproteobacteria bacterium]|nr:exodeoxyribonuclease V subunit gamma [Gammaproteobacteria bacterium]